MIEGRNTIKIDNKDVFRPNDFTPEREDVYAGEYTTCTGKTVADRIGWKYSDMSLEWDMLTDGMMSDILSLPASFDITFDDSDGSHTETVIKTGFANTATRFTNNLGNVIWKDVKLGVRFINTHNS